MADHWTSHSRYGCTKDLDHPGLEIHRFDMGKRVCRCGKYCIGAPVMKQQGWRMFARHRVKKVEIHPSAFDPDLDGTPDFIEDPNELF